MDPVTVEIIRNAFNAIADEMDANLVRSAFSPVIYEMKDCSVALYNEHGDLLGQAPGLPIFLGALDEAVKVIKDRFSKDGLNDGDVYALNDSYLSGSHLGDVNVISPIIHNGELVGFAANKAHWRDIGGKDPGTSTDTTDIYQEGIRLGPIRLYASGKPVEDVMDILARNSRMPSTIMGDMGGTNSCVSDRRDTLSRTYTPFWLTNDSCSDSSDFFSGREGRPAGSLRYSGRGILGRRIS